MEGAAEAVADIAVGGLPATPIMRWLLESGGPIDRFNQTMLLQVPAGLGEEDLIAALQAVLEHHDGLRLRLVAAAGDGDWSLEVAAPEGSLARACTRRVEVCGVCEPAWRACLIAEAQAAEQRLSPGRGATVQAARFDGGPQASGRLLLVIHHLAIDGDRGAFWFLILRRRGPR